MIAPLLPLSDYTGQNAFDIINDAGRNQATPASIGVDKIQGGAAGIAVALSPTVSRALAQINISINGSGTHVTTTQAISNYAGSAALSTSTTTPTSSITVQIAPTLRDLADEEDILRGKPYISPNIGPSKFADKLVQLATGSDLALAVQARQVLSALKGTGVYHPDGQQDVEYSDDADSGYTGPVNNLFEAAAYISSPSYAHSAITNIALALANDEQPNAYDVNFLHARTSGSFTLIDTTSFSSKIDMSQFDSDEIEAGGNSAFSYEVAINSGTQPLSEFSSTSIKTSVAEY